MIKIIFVFGTRPEAIKMAPVIQAFKAMDTKFEVVVCITAQHREMLDQVLKLFCIKPDYDLNIMIKRQSLINLTASVISGVTEVLEKENPDIVFVQGDTTTTFASAQAAYYLKIPVAHIEAGLRTGNKYSPFPEEINRRLTSVIADFHFAPTESAKKNLIAEGFEESSIYITGNTVIDTLMIIVRDQIVDSKKKELKNNLHEKWNLSLSANSNNFKLILVTAHRRESFGEGFKRICKALYTLANNNQNVQIIYPVHLNPNVQEPVYSILGSVKNIHLIPPLDYEHFVFLMNHSYIILTDSGGIQEEAPSLGVPVLVMRDNSERSEGIESGSARLVGSDTNAIVNETQKLLDNIDEYKRMSNVINPYGDGNASKRIVEIILEHYGGINERRQ